MGHSNGSKQKATKQASTEKRTSSSPASRRRCKSIASRTAALSRGAAPLVETNVRPKLDPVGRARPDLVAMSSRMASL
jgi:hypothetical protein